MYTLPHPSLLLGRAWQLWPFRMSELVSFLPRMSFEYYLSIFIFPVSILLNLNNNYFSEPTFERSNFKSSLVLTEVQRISGFQLFYSIFAQICQSHPFPKSSFQSPTSSPPFLSTRNKLLLTSSFVPPSCTQTVIKLCDKYDRNMFLTHARTWSEYYLADSSTS